MTENELMKMLMDPTFNILQTLWFFGWLFTLGYVRKFGFWKGLWAYFVWPFFLGKKYRI